MGPDHPGRVGYMADHGTRRGRGGPGRASCSYGVWEAGLQRDSDPGWVHCTRTDRWAEPSGRPYKPGTARAGPPTLPDPTTSVRPGPDTGPSAAAAGLAGAGRAGRVGRRRRGGGWGVPLGAAGGLVDVEGPTRRVAQRRPPCPRAPRHRRGRPGRDWRLGARRADCRMWAGDRGRTREPRPAITRGGEGAHSILPGPELNRADDRQANRCGC